MQTAQPTPEFDYTREMHALDEIIIDAAFESRDHPERSKFLIYEKAKRRMDDLMLEPRDWERAIERLCGALGI